jgi:hypothetical protein
MFAASLMLVLATPNDKQHMQRVFIVAAVQITLPTPARHPPRTARKDPGQNSTSLVEQHFMEMQNSTF